MLTIRPEAKKDYAHIKHINDLAFKQENEGILVEKLRKKSDFISVLSLIAENEYGTIGHILLFPLKIKSDKQEKAVLSLGPMAVLPEHQNKGIE